MLLLLLLVVIIKSVLCCLDCKICRRRFRAPEGASLMLG
jgi:hypothetical protein